MAIEDKNALPRKADGETVPLLRDTMTLMPVSTNGTEKSMTSDLSSLMVNEPTAITAFLYTTWKTPRRTMFTPPMLAGIKNKLCKYLDSIRQYRFDMFFLSGM